jgi:hypothetical protein
LIDLGSEVGVAVEVQPSSEAQSLVPNEAEVENAQSAALQSEDTKRNEFMVQLTRTTVEYINTHLHRHETLAVNENLMVVESADYRIKYYHNQENGETPVLQVQEKASNSTVFEVFRQDEQWHPEIVVPEASGWLEQAYQELIVAEQRDRTEFIEQLRRTTVQYFDTHLRQGDITEVNGNLAVAESEDYWVVYYHNQENGETPTFRVQEKATNAVVLEASKRDENWEVEGVQPGAEGWLEQATEELAAQQERVQQMQRPQMEL